MKHCLRWSGHLVRLEDTRIPKQIFYSELKLGKRKRCKPRKRYRDLLKDILKKGNIPQNDWEKLALDREIWKKSTFSATTHFESCRIQHQKQKRAARKGILTLDHTNANALFPCSLCEKISMSAAGLASHMRHVITDIKKTYVSITIFSN